MQPLYVCKRILRKHPVSFLRLWLVAACVFLSTSLFSQQSQTPYDIAGKSMNYFPASVEAAALFKRVPDEVDYSRGRVTVRIPLYEIKTSAFTLPISISYTTGGILADQKSGRIGLGWQLEAEPMISREIRGLRDEQSFLTDSSYRAQNQALYEAQVGSGEKDILPDFFHYRTLASSGKFILDMCDGYGFHPSLLTPERVDISVPGNRVGPWFDNEIRLTDQTGTVYAYGSTANSREFTRPGDGMKSVTCWKASSITTVDGETMGFEYKEYPEGERTKSNYDYYGFEDMGDYGPNGTEDIPPYPGYWKGVNGYEKYYYYEENGSTGASSFKNWFYNQSPSGRVYAPLDVVVDLRLVSRITFPNGSLEFVYSDADKTLQEIRVKDAVGSTLKRIVFTRHSEGYDRYLLDGVEIKNGSDGTIEKYRFRYYGLPAFASAFSPQTKAVDYWGYFNGHTENTDLVPEQTVEFRLSNNATKRTAKIGGAKNRWPSFEHARTYSLAGITYPTGGKTTFQYELNRFRYRSQGMTDAGGLRIKRIEDETTGGKTSVRSFDYRVSKTDTLAVGSLRFPLANWTYVQKLKKYYCSSDAMGLSTGSRVRDYRLYTSSNNVCPDQTVYYSMVVETTGNGVVKHYYDNYRFWPFDQFDDGAYTDSFHAPLFYEDYLSSGGVHEYYRQNTLEKDVADGRTTGMRYLTDLVKQSVIVDLSGKGVSDMQMRELYRNSYRTRDIEAYYVETKYGGSTTRTYSPAGVATETENTLMGSSPYWVVKKKYTQSADGDRSTVEYTYPFDYTGGVYSKMVERRDVSTPVEERYFRNGVLKKIVRRTYVPDTPGGTSLPGHPVAKGYLLQKTEETTDAACTSFREIERYTKYLSSGSPVELVKKDGTPVVLVWGYAGQRILAAIENATLSEVTPYFSYDLNALAASTAVSAPVYEKLDALASRLPAAKVNVFRYRPLVGVTAVGQPDGRSSYYGYDASGRLNQEQNTDFQPINTYEYHEKNQ